MRTHARSLPLTLIVALGLAAGLLVAVEPPASAEVDGHRVIGHSVRGRPLVALRMGDPASRRKVVVLASMHGDENGPARLIGDLRRGRAIRGADIWVVQRVNPDGVARHSRKNARGVDLNRNFPRHWRLLGGKYNSGRRPASEPETRALMAFLGDVRPAYVVSFHQPLRGVGRSGLRKGANLERRLARHLRLPRRHFNCSGRCHGTMTDWFNARFRGVAITVEYGHRLSRRQVRQGANGLLRAVDARR